MPLIKRTQILQRLEEQRVPFAELSLQNGVTLLISQLGGRIYGPFLSEESESLYWVPPIFGDADGFAAYLQDAWNYGGERLWIAPEIQFIVRNRFDYFGSIFVPRAMDPGTWKLEPAGPRRWRLSQDMSLEAYNLASGCKTLHLETTIHAVQNPLRHLGKYTDLMDSVTYAGYEQVATLKERQQDEILSGIWNLIMLNPGGELIIPCTPAVEPTCYKGNLDQRILSVHRNHVRLQITGDQMYKAGLKAAHTFGRMAYLHRRVDRPSYLLVRNFPNNPCAEYPEEPPEIPGQRGDSIHIYNDDGGFGELGEMECNGQTIGGPTGRSESVDTFSLWLYAGPVDRLQAILFEMLGIEF